MVATELKDIEFSGEIEGGWINHPTLHYEGSLYELILILTALIEFGIEPKARQLFQLEHVTHILVLLHAVIEIPAPTYQFLMSIIDGRIEQTPLSLHDFNGATLNEIAYELSVSISQPYSLRIMLPFLGGSISLPSCSTCC